MFALFAVFGQLRFGEAANTYKAEFTNVTGLENGDFVRIAGVEVGKVKEISIQPDTTVRVEFSADDSVVLTEGSQGRHPLRRPDRRPLSGAGGRRRRHRDAQAGRTIPLARTEPALDLDALIGGFRPLFRALDPDQVNALTGSADSGLSGSGRHDQLLPDPDRGVDQHPGRPRPADRRR